MRVKFTAVLGLCFAVLLGLFLTLNLAAQDKAPKGKKGKQENIQGRITLIKKDTSTITVNNNTVPRQVMYTPSTVFKYGHSDDSKPGSADKVQEGWYISCSGPVDAKAMMMATECVYRESR
jgi:hypothetical protein